MWASEGAFHLPTFSFFFPHLTLPMINAVTDKSFGGIKLYGNGLTGVDGQQTSLSGVVFTLL